MYISTLLKTKAINTSSQTLTLSCTKHKVEDWNLVREHAEWKIVSWRYLVRELHVRCQPGCHQICQGWHQRKVPLVTREIARYELASSMAVEQSDNHQPLNKERTGKFIHTVCQILLSAHCASRYGIRDTMGMPVNQPHIVIWTTTITQKDCTWKKFKL